MKKLLLAGAAALVLLGGAAQAEGLSELMVSVSDHEILVPCTTREDLQSLADVMNMSRVGSKGTPWYWVKPQWTQVDGQRVMGRVMSIDGSVVMFTPDHNRCFAVLALLLSRGYKAQ